LLVGESLKSNYFAKDSPPERKDKAN
jgi:hypothetical protein